MGNFMQDKQNAASADLSATKYKALGAGAAAGGSIAKTVLHDDVVIKKIKQDNVFLVILCSPFIIFTLLPTLSLCSYIAERMLSNISLSKYFIVLLFSFRRKRK